MSHETKKAKQGKMKFMLSNRKLCEISAQYTQGTRWDRNTCPCPAVRPLDQPVQVVYRRPKLFHLG